MPEPTYRHPTTGKPITPLTPEQQLAWTGGEPMGWDWSPEMSQYVETARKLGIHPSLGWLGNYPTWQSSGGDDVVEIEGRPYLVKAVNQFVENYPEGREWASKVSTQKVEAYKVDPQAPRPGDIVTQVTPADLSVLDKFMYNLSVSQMQGTRLPTRFSQFRDIDYGGAPPAYGRAGMPTTRYGAGVVEPEPWYPPARWGRPIEEVTEYARPEYEPAYYEMLEKAKPTVSPARYEWMESLRPELLRQWQAGRPVSEAEFARKPYTTEYEVAPVTSEEMAARVKELSKTMTLEAAEEQASAWAKGQLQRRALTAEEKARTGAAGLAKVAAQQRQAKWGAWTGIYPFKEEWYRMGQRERGIYPARFAPTARWTV